MTAIDLTRCPSLLSDGYTSFSPTALKSLFDGTKVSHILPFLPPSSNQADAIEALKNVGRLSLSGAQAKFGLILDNEELRYSTAKEQSSYILKPHPTGYHIINHNSCAANEHITMQLASQVYGITTAANTICFFKDGSMAYMTRRFDVHSGGKYAQEDFASLMGLTRQNGGSDYKYSNGSYEECAEIIRQNVKSYLIDLRRFFQIVVFNFITLNDDAHLKNFSLLHNGKEYHLSPAYDLINTSIHLREPRIFALEKGLFKEGMYLCDTRQVSYKDFVEFGRRIGLPDKLVMKELKFFTAPNEKADALLKKSFLSPELIKDYLSS